MTINYTQAETIAKDMESFDWKDGKTMVVMDGQVHELDDSSNLTVDTEMTVYIESIEPRLVFSACKVLNARTVLIRKTTVDFSDTPRYAFESLRSVVEV